MKSIIILPMLFLTSILRVLSMLFLTFAFVPWALAANFVGDGIAERCLIFLAERFPVFGVLLMFLGTLPVLISIWVALTPWKSDDEWFNNLKKYKWYFIFEFIGRWSLVKRK